MIGPTPSGPNLGGSYNDQATSGTLNIGFPFVFDCATYTTFSVNTSGLVILGNGTSGSFTNNLTSPPTFPILAPFWQRMSTLDGTQQTTPCNPPVNTGVSYQVTGTAPNRVLTIEWRTNLVNASGYWNFTCPTTSFFFQFQTRLYEGTNRIEFHYGSMWAASGQPTAASIGIAAGPTNFFSFTPSGGTGASVSASTANNAVALHLTPITSGTIYAFTPCYFRPVGNTAGGGTVAMAPGDTLLNQSYVYGTNPSTFTPFNLTFPSGSCPTRSYSLSITGPAATDYTFQSSGTQTLSGTLAAGGSISPVITFTPGSISPREATLTLTDLTNGCSRSYIIRPVVTPRVILTGNIAQGGTAAMASGDILLNGKLVAVGSSQTFTPFTATNINAGSLPAANVTYTITGGSGQYTINPANVSIPALGSNTPTITFTPLQNSVGPQSATLTITADGQTRTYTLNAVASIPTLRVSIAGQTVDSTSTLFTNRSTCVGEEVFSYPVDLENTSAIPVTLTAIDFFQTDTAFGQGTPRYALRRDGSGRPLRAGEYFISLASPTTPPSVNPVPAYPLVLAPQTSTRVYLSFVGSRPGKRFGRMYLRSNARNQINADTNGAMTVGLLRVDLFARGSGSRLSDNMVGGLPKTISFREMRIGESADTILVLANPGLCPLRISARALAISSGDADEFQIVRMPRGNIDAATGDMILAPGTADTMVIRFTPRHDGSRRASLRVVTNDSTITSNGMSERGTYYIDLYGRGHADLYASSHDFGTALMGGRPEDFRYGTIYVKNTTSAPVYLGEIVIEGADAGEFAEDLSKPWPQLPRLMMAGEEIPLSVIFAPAGGGVEGPRSATIKFIASNGDTVIGTLSGNAGSRTIAVSPGRVTFGVITVGKFLRQTVTITNTGSMPLHLQKPRLAGPDADLFQLGNMQRLELAPGQSEYLEITFVPTSPAQASATLEIASDAADGLVQVQLGGTSVKAKGRDDDPVGMPGRRGGDLVGIGTTDPDESVSSAGDAAGIAGMTLGQSLPNPGRDRIEISYTLAKSGSVLLALYDAAGRRVMVLDEGSRSAGERKVRFDASSLASGVYYYRLHAAGGTLTRTLTVMK